MQVVAPAGVIAVVGELVWRCNICCRCCIFVVISVVGGVGNCTR